MFCDPPSCFARPDGCTSLGWEKNIRLTAPALFTEISDDAGAGGGAVLRELRGGGIGRQNIGFLVKRFRGKSRHRACHPTVLGV